MEPYVVRSGDHLLALAHRLGFDADTVWNDPKNAALKALRGSPHILSPGDVLYVPPAPEPKWLKPTIGGVNSYVASVPRVKVSLTFMQAGKPVANAACLLRGLPPPADKATTDGDGKLEVSVPVTMKLLAIEIPALSIFRVMRIGDLDPVDTPSGMRQRLRNLGHLSDGGANDDEAVAVALADFQRSQTIEPSGTFDDATRKQLETSHGC